MKDIPLLGQKAPDRTIAYTWSTVKPKNHAEAVLSKLQDLLAAQ